MVTMTAADPEQPQPLSGQMVLWEDGDAPVDSALVGAAKVYVHTGKTTCRNEELAAEIVECVLLGVTERGVARRVGVSRNTVRATMELMESLGKLEPLKRRLSRKLGRLLELTTDEAMRMLEERRVPPNCIPIWYGVFSDKKGGLDQDAEMAGAPAKPALTPADLVAWRQRLVAWRESGADAQSAGAAAQVIDVQVSPPADPVLDPVGVRLPSPVAPGAPAPAAVLESSGDRAPAASGPVEDRGGGGLEAAGGPRS
jgi:hypothetical protein